MLQLSRGSARWSAASASSGGRGAPGARCQQAQVHTRAPGLTQARSVAQVRAQTQAQAQQQQQRLLLPAAAQQTLQLPSPSVLLARHSSSTTKTTAATSSTPEESNPTAVLAALHRMYSKEEIDFYLQQFRRFTGPAFAIIKVGGEVVEDELDVLCASCSLLANLGLMPIIIHGGGPQMNRELARRNVEPNYVGGHRVTDKATLEIAQNIFTGLNERVVAALKRMGAKAQGFPRGVFEAEMRRPELGFVGEVTGVRTSGILQALEEGRIPVLTSLGESSSIPNQELNINADVAARELAIVLRPMRVVFTSSKGGWIDDETGQLLPTVDMTREYERLANRDYTGRQGTLLKLNEIKTLLDHLPSTSAVAITSASSITKELFTHRGGGSLFLKGEPLHKFESIGSLDLDRLRVLMTRQSKGGLSDIDFQSLQASLAAAYVFESYSACAIVTRSVAADDPLGGRYVLEHMCVDPAARGMGQDEVLWRRLKEEYPSLAWLHLNGCYDPGFVHHAHANIRDPPTGALVGWYDSPGAGTVEHPSWDSEYAKKLLNTGVPSAQPSSTQHAKTSKWTSGAVKPRSSSKEKIKVALLGARGYVGREFMKLIVQHPDMELVLASSRAMEGESVIQAFGLGDAAASGGVDAGLKFEAVEPEDVASHPRAAEVDVWVLALPNGLAPKWVGPLESVGKQANNGSGALLIDLGADFRFTDDWVYGLPERPGARDKLRGARRIANPGCYATGAQVGIMPLVQNKLLAANSAPHIFGVSGYSGAGTNPSDKNNPVVLKDNLIPYSLVKHIHEREVSRHLGTRVAFMPHVAPYFQGISLTISANLGQGTKLTGKDVAQVFADFYRGERLIKIKEDMPMVRDNMMRHDVTVGGFVVDPDAGRLALVATIDNLLKGAATQAVQNINIALGVEDELAGIVE